MEVREVTAREYGEYFGGRPHIYNSAAFNALNSHKVRDVKYLFIGDGKTRFGIITGDGRSPFSAPFGGFDYNKEQGFEQIDEAVAALKAYAHTPLRITLPPAFYDEDMVTMTASALLRQGRLLHADVNYHFVTADVADIDRVLDVSGKKNLRRGMECFDGDDGVFVVAADADEAYEVIRRNRMEHGYPLRMSLEEVKKTIELVPADFFVLTREGVNIAAAQVFHVAGDIVQVIYWGDLRAYSRLRPMNYLAYRIFNHYHDTGVRIVDVGPSSENGMPNYGLCKFKRSIGCRASLKYTFSL